MALITKFPLQTNVDPSIAVTTANNNGVTFVNDAEKGDVAKFDNDYFSVNNNFFEGKSEFSVSFWVKLNSTSTSQAIIAKWYNRPLVILLYYNENTGWRLLMRDDYNESNPSIGHQSTFSQPINVWTHITITYKSGVGIKFYQDSVYKESSSIINATIISPDEDSFTVGSDGGYRFFLDGFLSDLQIHDKELTQSEINEIYSPTISETTYKYELVKNEEGELIEIRQRGSSIDYVPVVGEGQILETDFLVETVEMCNGCLNSPSIGSDLPIPERS